MVGQQQAAFARRQLLPHFFNELQQVIDLLELAPRVLIEPPIAGQDVQLLEQLDGLAGAQAQLGMQIRRGLKRRLGFA